MNENYISVSLAAAGVSRAVYQYNSGQILRFEETIEDNTEIHFCNIKSEEAIVRRIVNNEVTIPAELIAEGLTITAYVHKVTADAETTIFEFDIQIKSRVKQDDEIAQDDVQTFKEYVEEKIQTNEAILQQIDVKANKSVENVNKTATAQIQAINNTATAQIQAINNTATAQIQAASNNIDALTTTKIQSIDTLVGAKMTDLDNLGIAKISDINSTASAQIDAINNTVQAQAKALEVQADAHKQELLEITNKERSWKKIRKVTVPAADACGTTVDGVKYGGNSEKGVRTVKFTTDENGNSLEGSGIVGVRVKFASIPNATAINQGFLQFNNLRILYFAGLKPTAATTYVLEDCLIPYRVAPSSNTGYTIYNHNRVNEKMGNEITTIMFEGFEDTSILGEGATLEFWAYGYFD